MPHVYQLKDGSVRTIFDMRSAMEIIEETAGYEIREYLEDAMRDFEEESKDYEKQFDAWEKERDAQSDERHALLCELREGLDEIIGLLNSERLNRKKLLDCISRLRRKINSVL